MFQSYTQYDNCEPAGVKLPSITLEGDLAGMTSADALRELCLRGAKEKKLDEKPNKQEYYDRIKTELATLEELGFTDYVLLNWDILRFCHEEDIMVGDGRGSAAGSLVLYLVKVTNVDPIKYDLFFERFVSKSRARNITGPDGEVYLDGSLLCDVDNDISYEHRPRVIEYIEKKYVGKTSKILTFNTLTAKACIRECTKYFDGAQKEEADYASSLIPKLHGKVVGLKDSSDQEDDFKKWVGEHQTAFDIALKLEGLIKNTGVHPSGIAICSTLIEEIIPVQMTKDGDLISAYEMNDVADLMVKFDILGLRTLSLVERTCKRINISPLDIDPEDPFIYKCMQQYEHPYGLFQISAETNFKVAQHVAPLNLSEMADVVALARPGCLAFLEDYVEQKKDFQPLGKHEEMDKILSRSKNVLLFQEQTMAIAHRVFGFSLEEADDLRRIIGKKKVKEMPAWKEKIYEAGEKLGIDKELCDYYWQVCEDSAHYSFNLSHSVAYAMLAAKTAYLKFNHPAEFFCSALEISEFEQEPLKEVSEITVELPFFGLELLPPNLKNSTIHFNIEGEKTIRYGLGAIKGVSTNTHDALKLFSGHAEFKNKYEVFLAAKASGINVGILSSLIYSGCLGLENRHRLALEAQAFNLLTDREKRNLALQVDNLGDDVLIALDRAYKEKIPGDSGGLIIKESRLNTFKGKFQRYKELYLHNKKYLKFCSWWFEKFLLGYSYSYSLKECFLDGYNSLISVEELKDLPPKNRFKCVGQVKDFYVNTSANGNRYMRLNLIDGSGYVTGLFCDQRAKKPLSDFLKVNSLTEDDIVILSGSTGDDGTPFINKITPIDTEIYTNTRQLI